jgi:hypothetical protein
MIDATKSPMPTWKRYGLFVLMAALVLVAGATIWTKELHHSIPGLSKSKPAASAPTSSAPAPAAHSTASATSKPAPAAIPGGIPVSSRNPFGP